MSDGFGYRRTVLSPWMRRTIGIYQDDDPVGDDSEILGGDAGGAKEVELYQGETTRQKRHTHKKNPGVVHYGLLWTPSTPPPSWTL